jgi:integrase
MSRVFERKKGEWWIDFKDARGVRHRRKIGPNKRVAKEVLDGILGNVARRAHLGIIEDSAISFADFAKIWWERVSPTLRPRSQKRWSGIVEKHLMPAFSGGLRSVAKAQAEKYAAQRLDEGAAPSTVNREMTVLKHMLKRAVAWEYLSSNPVAGIKALKEPSGRTRFLTLEEMDRLLAVCEATGSPYLKAFVVVALNTGMRRNEILSLRRKGIDWMNRIVTLEDTKNGESRHVFLNDAALEALRCLPSPLNDGGHLFPFTPNQVSMAVRRVLKRAGIEDFCLHDLRHTFASYHAMSGVQGRGLQALLGHKDNRMTMR